MEQWKPIFHYEGQYEVSNYGRIRSIERETEYINRHGGVSKQRVKAKYKKPSLKDNGYWAISLYQNNKVKFYYVHRLVADAFVDGYSVECSYVNHKDYDRSNNHADNLEWVSMIQNNTHSTINRKNPSHTKHVNVFYEDGTVVPYESVFECSRQINIHRDTLGKYLQGKPGAGSQRLKELKIRKIEVAQ